MSKVAVYLFSKYEIGKDKSIKSKRWATLESIRRYGGIPIIDTEKEVDISELDEEGRFPKTFKVIYYTEIFPILNSNTGKQKTAEFPSFESAMAAPFPTDDQYVFASIEVGDGWFTRSVTGNKWEFQSGNE